MTGVLPAADFVFADAAPERSGNVVTLQTDVVEGGSTRGYVFRSFNLATGDITLDDAFLDDIPSEQRWVATTPEMVPGKGTFLETYITMRQMRQAEDMAGNPALFARRHTVTIRMVVNNRTVLELARLEKAGVPLDEAIAQTYSVQYANRAITATGGRIASVRVGGLSDWRAADEEFEQDANLPPGELARYGLKATDEIRDGFDIILAVEPDPAAPRTTPPAPPLVAQSSP